MTTLSSKLNDVTKQLQQLTVWKPNEHDPFIELHRWRDAAHEFIEETYRNKRNEIENLIERHERSFMKQIARQRLLLESLRQRIVATKLQNDLQMKIQNETSIFTDLQKIEQDISVKLGRGEIRIESKPIEAKDLVKIHLKTFLANTALQFHDEKPMTQRSTRASTQENDRAYQNWLKSKTPKKETIILEKRVKRQVEEERQRRSQESQRRFDEWVQNKKEKGAFRRKKIIDDPMMSWNETHLIPNEFAQS